MEYEFTKENRLDKPHRYMYTKYYGKPFLEAWKTDRLNIIGENVEYSINNIKGKLSEILKIEEDENSTTDILKNLYLDILNNKDKEQNYSLISKYIKKYEVTKKLYTDYSGEMKAIGDSYDNPEPYVWLSLCCSLYWFSNNNFKMVNCLLKLNDCISSIEKTIKDDTIKKLIVCAFSFEQIIISSISKNCEVQI